MGQVLQRRAVGLRGGLPAYRHPGVSDRQRESGFKEEALAVYPTGFHAALQTQARPGSTRSESQVPYSLRRTAWSEP